MNKKRYSWSYFLMWLGLKKKYFLTSALAAHDDYNKFIILCGPRTGSTLLHTYLNSHPQVLSRGEILRRVSDVVEHPKKHIFNRVGRNIKAVGFKLFYDDCLSSKNENFIQYLKSNDVSVIHIYRKNKQEQYTSWLKAQKSGHWNDSVRITSESPQPTTLEFSKEKLQEFTNQQESKKLTCLNLFKESSILQLTYEQLTTHKEDTLNDVQSFLSIQPKKLRSLLVKQS